MGRGVARTKGVAERLAGEITEAEQGMKTEATFVGRRGVLFGLGEPHHQCRVEVENHGLTGRVELRPHFLAHLSECSCELATLNGVELVKGAIDRRVRGNITEEILLHT